MDDFPGNSRESENTPKINYVRNPVAEPNAETKTEGAVGPVVTGKVTRKPQSLSRKFGRAFFGMGFKDTMEDVLWNVIVPDARHMVEDIVTGAVRRAIWGENNPPSRGSDLYTRASNYIAGRQGHINYARQYQVSTRSSRTDPPPREVSRQERKYHNFDELTLETRADADNVLSHMYLHLETYERVPVSSFYSMLDITPDSIDSTWGWTDLQGSEVRRHPNGGYYIRLPRPTPLKRNG